MNLMALPLAVLLFASVGELWWRGRRYGERAPWREFALNLGSGHLVMWFFRTVEIAAFAFVLRHANFHWVDSWPSVMVWLFAFVAWDFCFYWMHRLHHRLPLLWAVHVVHHQGEHFNLSLGVRNSWYSSLSNLPFIIALAVLGVPLPVFVIVSSIHYGIQFYNHNSLVGHCGVLERFLVTPSHHRVHHAMAPIYRSRNFGGTFLWWDKLFGTFQPAVPRVPLLYGTSAGAGSDNPWVANHAPFLKFLTRQIQRKHRHERPFSPVADDSAGERATPPALIGWGAVALFAVVVVFILFGQGGWDTRDWLTFGMIVLATIALGGMAEGRAWALPVWLLVAVGLAGRSLAGVQPAMELESAAMLRVLHGLNAAVCLSLFAHAIVALGFQLQAGRRDAA